MVQWNYIADKQLWQAKHASDILTAEVLPTHINPASWKQFSTLYTIENVTHDLYGEFLFRPWLSGYETTAVANIEYLFDKRRLFSDIPASSFLKEHINRAKRAIHDYCLFDS